MVKMISIAFLILLLGTVNASAQAARKMPASRPPSAVGTVTGTLNWGGDGQGMQYVELLRN